MPFDRLNSRHLGLLCAVAAVLLGLAYLAMAGAPARYLAINLAALAVGMALFALLSRLRAESLPAGPAMLVLAGTILATTLWGTTADGATRWLRVGGLLVQPAMVLLPLMLVWFAAPARRNLLSTIAMIVTAAALALQPDRAMAGVLAAGLGVLALRNADRLTLATWATSLAAFAVTLLRTDALPPAPFVEQVLYSSFDTGLLAGTAVLTGCLLMLAPAVAGLRQSSAGRGAHMVFGTAWLAVILAAALGNYPTPLVGYGGSAIIGYLFSLALLPRVAPGREGSATGAIPERPTDRPKDLDRRTGIFARA